MRTLSSPHVVFANSSRPASPSPHSETPSPGPSSAARHPPSEPAARQPMLVRSSQITGTAASAGRVHKAVLKLNGDLGMMAVGWANEEWTCRRRLVQFWRTQDGNTIDATFRPIAQADFVPNSIVISCIFRDDKNECYVTSVDTIYLLEALVGGRFTVEEKNRIRRNLEGFKPTTVSKSKADSEPFFSTIMGYVAPKPRTIEKDVKVFPWKVLSSALKKIIGKYVRLSPAPVASVTDESAVCPVLVLCLDQPAHAQALDALAPDGPSRALGPPPAAAPAADAPRPVPQHASPCATTCHDSDGPLAAL